MEGSEAVRQQVKALVRGELKHARNNIGDSVDELGAKAVDDLGVMLYKIEKKIWGGVDVIFSEVAQS